MAELLPIRSFSRSQRYSIGLKRIHTNRTVSINLSNPEVRRDLGHHAAIGAFYPVGPLTITADAGYVAQGGAVTQTTPASLTVNVAPGALKVRSSYDANNNPVYPAGFTTFAATTKTVGAADATNPRIDLVSVNNAGVVTLTPGTAAASPVAPALPANSVELARITVRAAATTVVTSDINDVR